MTQVDSARDALDDLTEAWRGFIRGDRAEVVGRDPEARVGRLLRALEEGGWQPRLTTERLGGWTLVVRKGTEVEAEVGESSLGDVVLWGERFLRRQAEVAHRRDAVRRRDEALDAAAGRALELALMDPQVFVNQVQPDAAYVTCQKIQAALVQIAKQAREAAARRWIDESRNGVGLEHDHAVEVESLRERLESTQGELERLWAFIKSGRYLQRTKDGDGWCWGLFEPTDAVLVQRAAGPGELIRNNIPDEPSGV